MEEYWLTDFQDASLLKFGVSPLLRLGFWGQRCSMASQKKKEGSLYMFNIDTIFVVFGFILNIFFFKLMGFFF